MVPLIYPPVPPLVDLLGHMGRYRVQLDLGSSPWLHRYYDFEWAAIGNLGVDLLIEPLAPIFGLELAVKLIVLAIPPMTVAGFLWVAREVHNRIPPTALFALPFAYGHPFLFGFTNFALSMALAFLAFGLWLRLGRLGRTRLRAMLFVPISLVIFFAHTFGWGTLGLLAFSADAVRQHDRGETWPKAAFKAALNASVMALPLVVMLAWRIDVRGGLTGDWFNLEAKFDYLVMALRDRWRVFDVVSLLLVTGVLVEALRNPRLGFSRNLAFSALVLISVFVLLPRIIFGSAYADMRLVPYMIAVAVLAIRFRHATHRPTAQLLAVVGVAFYLVRIAATTSKRNSKRSTIFRWARRWRASSARRAAPAGRFRARPITERWSSSAATAFPTTSGCWKVSTCCGCATTKRESSPSTRRSESGRSAAAAAAPGRSTLR